MRKPGKSDILYFFFLSLLIAAMLYGGISLIIDTFYNPPMFHIASSGITATGILFYFYYPPNGVFSTLIPLPFWVGVLAIVGIYSILFLMLIRFNSKNMGENPLASPVGFISGYGSIAFGFSILIIALVALIGFPIEAPGLTNLQSHPRFLYYQLIYAPIIEETEFRIIPLGVYLYLRYRFTGVKSTIDVMGEPEKEGCDQYENEVKTVKFPSGSSQYISRIEESFKYGRFNTCESVSKVQIHPKRNYPELCFFYNWCIYELVIQESWM